MTEKFEKVMCKDCIYCGNGRCRKETPSLKRYNDWAVWPIISLSKDWCGKGKTK